MKENAIELGFNPTYQEMTKEQTKLLMSVILGSMEGNEPDIPESENPFPIRMIEKRIEVMNLPIELKPSAKVAMLILTDGNPGKMNIALIDILTKLEGENVGISEICKKIYPNGFYSDKSAMDYIDNYLKTKKAKWSEIY